MPRIPHTINIAMRLAVLACLALSLSACGIASRGGPLWSPDDHNLTLEQGETTAISIPAGDYLSLTVILTADTPVSDEPEYNPRFMHFAGFRFLPPSGYEKSKGQSGRFVYSFVCLDAGEAVVEIRRMGPDKRPTDEVYASLTVTITE
ncbi:hypothetical protein dsat_1220 [Alkalidesulfovibrio alkalitolerans DSM 16529]|jgi:predicted small lipoprotein YifL|uniref:Lipoprotein n=1 Tax=Alkalidesulfovibrio alkalitolerans DSM 16529 TaxID=1121439 RepID=S7UE40_9BACT|nr:hypothetical protein [Alkalidesulfovibrio alkalitolerans]EPR30498.1 hypothetical protein dsat_1220 [Alkalidesulfovibrio alkalitolerans DSM 16529]